MKQATDISAPIQDRVRFRLRACFLASFCVHAVLLMPFAGVPNGDLDGPEQTTLSVELSVTKPSKDEPAARVKPKPASRRLHPIERRVSARKSVPQPVQSILSKTVDTKIPARVVPPAIRDIEPVAPARLTGPPMVKDAIDTEFAGSRQTSVRAQISNLLLTDIARHFSYPVLAQRRGWQGEVLVSITVYPNGELDRIHVSQSSGYAVLDRDAEDTLRRIGKLGKSGRWPDARALELLLPVEYRLTD